MTYELNATTGNIQQIAKFLEYHTKVMVRKANSEFRKFVARFGGDSWPEIERIDRPRANFLLLLPANQPWNLKSNSY